MQYIPVTVVTMYKNYSQHTSIRGSNFVPVVLFQLPRRARLSDTHLGSQLSPVGRREVRRTGWPGDVTKS